MRLMLFFDKFKILNSFLKKIKVIVIISYYMCGPAEKQGSENKIIFLVKVLSPYNKLI